MPTKDVLEGRCGSGGSVFNRKLYGGPAWIRAGNQPAGQHWAGYKKSGYCDCCDPHWKLGTDGKARRMVNCTVTDLRAQIAALEEVQAEYQVHSAPWRAYRDCIEQLELLLPEEGSE